VHAVCKLEKWISRYKHTVERWFEVVAFFYAENSLANFHFNHPKFVFPEISSEKQVIESLNLGHPLLKVEKRIDNDFNIKKEEFFIITGANMAGKSTFLRTVSLSIVMANAGLPVCATSFKYAPIKLITSMRTSDSLSEEASYFYSELKRLKFIVDQIENEDYFIILDEILKGTNSKDKAIGSKKFVEKLSKSKSTGIIATHDVSLCELEREFAGIKNYYFDAEIIENEMYFDYSLKNGVCKNMNASFLLQKMEII
jgi:DNA mismatch repair ATPase MutS